MWAALPRFTVEGGDLPEPKPGVTFTAGLAIDLVPAPGFDGPERQLIRGKMRSAAHAVVIEGPVIAVVVGVAEIRTDLLPREVEVTGVVWVEPYLWGPGAIRDAAPEGSRKWTIDQVETITRGGDYRVLMRAV